MWLLCQKSNIDKRRARAELFSRNGNIDGRRYYDGSYRVVEAASARRRAGVLSAIFDEASLAMMTLLPAARRVTF